jgi:hypothetical protein
MYVPWKLPVKISQRSCQLSMVFHQMVQLGPGRINQLDWKKLDNEKIVVHSTCPAHEAVIL